MYLPHCLWNLPHGFWDHLTSLLNLRISGDTYRANSCNDWGMNNPLDICNFVNEWWRSTLKILCRHAFHSHSCCRRYISYGNAEVVRTRWFMKDRSLQGAQDVILRVIWEICGLQSSRRSFSDVLTQASNQACNGRSVSFKEKTQVFARD